MKLSCRDRKLDIDRPCITGVLNVTPDSFYAESRIGTIDALLKQVERYLHEGADVLEIGGESTGPSSKEVSEKEEMQRILPAIIAVKKHFPSSWISIDTWKAEVAREALNAGADIVNDVTAGRGDPAIFSIVANARCPFILMYSKDSTARTTIQDIAYKDVVATVFDFFSHRMNLAVENGVQRDSLIIDPGLGHFVSSNPKYSYELLTELSRLSQLAPVLVSPSRKSFLAGNEQAPAEDRLQATIAASCVAVCSGASWIRTHDVGATKKALERIQSLFQRRFS